jgi:hypothetical protein
MDSEVGKIVDKLQKLRALRQARERVRQLEMELNGEPVRPQVAPHVPEFLRRPMTAQVSR